MQTNDDHAYTGQIQVRQLITALIPLVMGGIILVRPWITLYDVFVYGIQVNMSPRLRETSESTTANTTFMIGPALISTIAGTLVGGVLLWLGAGLLKVAVPGVFDREEE